MKNALLFDRMTSVATTRMFRFLLFAAFFFGTQLGMLNAQANLSVQGILKKANGEAVADNAYNLTFKLYTQPVGGTAIWTETQSDVEVTSGIYSTILGNIEPLDVSFNQLYYLGVTVGSTEMTPRIQLTSAPYALSIIGNTNQFPSSGQVLADSVKVNGSVLARGGAPGLNGANRNGYAFSGNNGDKDSGLFSTSDGKVSMYVNNLEILAATPDSVALRADLRLKNNANINYNGLDDWRLVVVEDFDSGANGWQVYGPCCSEFIGWNNSTPVGAAPVAGSNDNFVGKYLAPAANEQVLKKEYDLSAVGTFTSIKVKFKYHLLDTWDPSQNDRGLAGFATAADGSGLRIGWMVQGFMANYTYVLNTSPFLTTTNYGGDPNQPAFADYWLNGEMTAKKNGSSNSFWLYFMNAHDQGDETYGIGMIEIWVK